MKKKDNYESMDTNRDIRTNKSRPNQNLSIDKDAGGELHSNKRSGSTRRSGCRLCDKGDDGRDETPVPQDHSGETTDTRRTKLKPIETKSFYDKEGIYYSANNLWKVWKFIPNKRYGDTKLETAYIRVVRVHNLLHKLYKSAEAMQDVEALRSLKKQQAITIEVMRILQQEILIERGWDRKELQQQENERLWEQKIW